MELVLVLALVAIGLAVMSVAQIVYALRLKRKLHALTFAKRSQSTRYGQITEQFAPFMASWPWDPKEFRFLGSPIDGVQFTETEVVLIEIKSGNSQLNGKQRRIRSLVKQGKVRFEEVRIQ